MPAVILTAVAITRGRVLLVTILTALGREIQTRNSPIGNAKNSITITKHLLL